MDGPGHAGRAEGHGQGMTGSFITFEGPEGGGKSTQVALLAQRLMDAGYEVVQAREPGGTRVGEQIRHLLQHDSAGEGMCPAAETLLFEASRAQLVHEVIAPALARGAVVLCDRFADSTTAYQGYGRGFDPDVLAGLHAFALGDCWPALTLLLWIPALAGLERIALRTRTKGEPLDRMEREDAAFHERVAGGYQALADRYPERIRCIDASGSVDEVHARVWDAVQVVLGAGRDGRASCR